MVNWLAPNKYYFWLAISWTLFIVIMCLISSANIPKIEISGADKYVHAIIHILFTFLWFMSFLKFGIAFSKSIFYAFLFSVAFGLLIEILQKTLTTTRQFDIFDIISNISGAVLTYIIVLICNKKKYFSN